MKKIGLLLLMTIVLIGLLYFATEQIISLKISSGLKEKFGDNYAILKMQIGGEPVERVSLWRMLKAVYTYNFTKKYEPQGSAGLTGKSYYLTPLISDNDAIYLCNWSFRMFKLDFSDSSIASWDIIDNLPDNIAPLYRFNKRTRKRRGYLWVSDNFNNDKVCYYYRTTKSLDVETSELNSFSGEWFTSDDSKGLSFTLELQQNGEKLTGKYTAIAMHGNRIDADPDAGRNIHGSINGNKADVVFGSFYGQGMGPRGSEIGKAIIVRKGDHLEWRVVDPPENGYYFCPDSAVLRMQEKINKAFEKEGNIFYHDGSKVFQLTGKGQNRTPVLSPDGRMVAFLRKSEREAYLSVGGREDFIDKKDLLGDQIWIVTIDGKKEWLACKDRTPAESGIKGITESLRRTIAHIDDPSLQFSPDSKKIYFISSAWVTSGAVHSVNIDGTGEQFITDGNTLQVIDKGGAKGYLIIRRHKYFLTGGSYDWLWLVSPEGKEIGPLSDYNEDNIDWDFLYSEHFSPYEN